MMYQVLRHHEHGYWRVGFHVRLHARWAENFGS